MSSSLDKTDPAIIPAILSTETRMNDPLACDVTSASGSRLPDCRVSIEPTSELCKDAAHRFLLALAKAAG